MPRVVHAMLSSCIAGQQGAHFSIRWCLHWVFAQVAQEARTPARAGLQHRGLRLPGLHWLSLPRGGRRPCFLRQRRRSACSGFYLAIPVGCGSLALIQTLELLDAMVGLVTHRPFRSLAARGGCGLFCNSSERGRVDDDQRRLLPPTHPRMPCRDRAVRGRSSPAFFSINPMGRSFRLWRSRQQIVHSLSCTPFPFLTIPLFIFMRASSWRKAVSPSG